MEHTAQYLQIRVGALPVPWGVASIGRGPDVRQTETSAKGGTQIDQRTVRGLDSHEQSGQTVRQHQHSALAAYTPVRRNTAPYMPVQRRYSATYITIPDRVNSCTL